MKVITLSERQCDRVLIYLVDNGDKQKQILDSRPESIGTQPMAFSGDVAHFNQMNTFFLTLKFQACVVVTKDMKGTLKSQGWVFMFWAAV